MHNVENVHLQDFQLNRHQTYKLYKFKNITFFRLIIYIVFQGEKTTFLKTLFCEINKRKINLFPYPFKILS